jgi:hypothetical protein
MVVKTTFLNGQVEEEVYIYVAGNAPPPSVSCPKSVRNLKTDMVRPGNADGRTVRPPPLGFLPKTDTKLEHRYGMAKKRRRPYCTAFPDWETSYSTVGGVSLLYLHVRPTFRASLRQNKKKKVGHGAPKQSNIFCFSFFYVFLTLLLHFFASLCFSCNIMSYF